VIVSTLKIYTSVMKWGSIRRISVPQIGLADGLVRMMYRQRKQCPLSTWRRPAASSASAPHLA
jgi:hypothetical protein